MSLDQLTYDMFWTVTLGNRELGYHIVYHDVPAVDVDAAIAKAKEWAQREEGTGWEVDGPVVES